MSDHHKGREAPVPAEVRSVDSGSAWRQRQRQVLRALVEAANRASGYEARRAAFDAIGRELLRIAREDSGLFAELWGIGGTSPAATVSEDQDHTTMLFTGDAS